MTCNNGYRRIVPWGLFFSHPRLFAHSLPPSARLPPLPPCVRSCIDGRLTSAWNWCSQLNTKPYFPVFKL
ncbi:unnamed protein product, partial [Discosporangium mesarthrocarpum]